MLAQYYSLKDVTLFQKFISLKLMLTKSSFLKVADYLDDILVLRL